MVETPCQVSFTLSWVERYQSAFSMLPGELERSSFVHGIAMKCSLALLWDINHHTLLPLCAPSPHELFCPWRGCLILKSKHLFPTEPLQTPSGANGFQSALPSRHWSDYGPGCEKLLCYPLLIPEANLHCVFVLDKYYQEAEALLLPGAFH